METRAKTIADLVRDGRFQKRKEEGKDTAEGSRSFSNAIPEAIDKLSPQQEDLCRSGTRRSVGCTDDSPCCTI
jgi:hypothetical protein